MTLFVVDAAGDLAVVAPEPTDDELHSLKTLGAVGIGYEVEYIHGGMIAGLIRCRGEHPQAAI